MIGEILDTSRLDVTQEKQNAETFDLSDTLPQICGPYQLIAKAKQLDFCFKIQQKRPVCISKRSLEKILSNLLSNPGRKLMRLFEPFCRPDFARDQKDGENGFGLYIVKTLSNTLGISYTFKPIDSPPGMRFALFFHDSLNKAVKFID